MDANHIYSFFCDDIRRELNQKFSATGLYANTIVFQELPIIFGKLVFFTRWDINESGTFVIKSNIFGQEKEILRRNIEATGTSYFAHNLANQQMVEGEIVFTSMFINPKGEEVKSAITLNVITGDVEV